MSAPILFAFLLGGGTLAFEVFGPRLIQAHFGYSPVLWASVISVFLGGLTVGYFLGAKMADHARRNLAAAAAWAVAGILVLLSPQIAGQVADLFLSRPGDPPVWEPLAGAFLIFFLPTVAMGTALPVLVGMAPSHGRGAGSHAGRLLGISTLGSILGVLGLTFGLVGRLTHPQIALALSLPWLLAAAWSLRLPARGWGAPLALVAFMGASPLGETTLWEGDSLLHHIKVSEDATHRALFFDSWMESIVLKSDPMQGHFH